MTQTFQTWTEYDTWLVQNYDQFSIYSIQEKDGTINIEYCPKADFPAIRDNNYKKPERRG